MKVYYEITHRTSGDTTRGETTYPDNTPEHAVVSHWSEGNYACDCNRGIMFEKRECDLDDYECGEGMFSVKVYVEEKLIYED